MAATHGRTKSAGLLIDLGAKTELENDHNRSAIIYASHAGHHDIVDMLQEDPEDRLYRLEKAAATAEKALRESAILQYPIKKPKLLQFHKPTGNTP